MKQHVLLVDFSFAKYTHSSQVSCVSSFLPPPIWKRLLSLFTHKLYLEDNPNLENVIQQMDVIILFDTRKNYDEVARRIERDCSPTARLIFYSWNPLCESKAHSRLSERWIKATFSKKDAACAGFIYVGSFYFKNVLTENVLTTKWDGLFIGQDKGRREMLYKVASLYRKNRLQSRIILVNNRKALFSRRYSWHIDYNVVCKNVQASNSVIEILQEGQEGISLRAFESMFYEKKLVTNNQHIVNYDFYNSHNIFILGKDDESGFKAFIQSPYVKLSDAIVEKYKMASWLNRMLSL